MTVTIAFRILVQSKPIRRMERGDVAAKLIHPRKTVMSGLPFCGHEKRWKEIMDFSIFDKSAFWQDVLGEDSFL